MTIRVKPVIELGGNGNTLERSLRPLWMATHYGGITLDWCKEFPNRSRISIAIRWISIVGSFFLLISGFGFELYQLSMEITKSNSTISSIMPNLLWFSSYPSSIATLFIFIFNHKDLLLLFKDWADLEMKQQGILFQMKSHLKRLLYCVYGGYGLLITCGFVIGFFTLLNDPDATYLLSHYKVIREALTLPVIILFHMVSLIHAYVFNIIADLAPAWTFYHAGQMLRSLSLEVEEHFLRLSNDLPCKAHPSYHDIRAKYETLSQLTERANRLFGWINIVNYGVLLAVICSESYIVVSNIRSSNLFTYYHFFVMTIYVMRLLTSFLIASQLETASEKFRLAVSILLAGEAKLGQEECKKWELFLNRLREGALIGRPLDLFEMSPSLVLTIVNLIITYVIVLLQSNTTM